MLALLAAIDWQTGATLIVIAIAIGGVGMGAAARGWKGERDAMDVKVTRLEHEAVEARRAAEEFRDEQQKLRHDLKEELAALRKLRDPTEVLQHVLAKLDTTVGTVAELLQRAEERAAARDQVIIETQRALVEAQREIADRLERLVDRITGEVAEVVQEKVDQLQPPDPKP